MNYYYKSVVCKKQAYKKTTENIEAAAQPDDVRNTAEQDVISSPYFLDTASICKDAYELRISWHDLMHSHLIHSELLRFGLCPSSRILKIREYSISENGPVSVIISNFRNVVCTRF
jgi:hypothetical protein